MLASWGPNLAGRRLQWTSGAPSAARPIRCWPLFNARLLVRVPVCTHSHTARTLPPCRLQLPRPGGLLQSVGVDSAVPPANQHRPRAAAGARCLSAFFPLPPWHPRPLSRGGMLRSAEQQRCGVPCGARISIQPSSHGTLRHSSCDRRSSTAGSCSAAWAATTPATCRRGWAVARLGGGAAWIRLEAGARFFGLQWPGCAVHGVGRIARAARAKMSLGSCINFQVLYNQEAGLDELEYDNEEEGAQVRCACCAALRCAAWDRSVTARRRGPRCAALCCAALRSL